MKQSGQYNNSAVRHHLYRQLLVFFERYLRKGGDISVESTKSNNGGALGKALHMSWEVRGGKKYYTRSRRIRGRVVREYIGGGIVGELAAEADAAAREKRQQELKRDRELERQSQEFDRGIEGFDSAADNLARAILIVAGNHQHNRGEWRRHNGRK